MGVIHFGVDTSRIDVYNVYIDVGIVDDEETP